MKRQIRIGFSGWNYKPWRKSFYPPKLPQRKELEFASRQINTLEINGTFYSLKKPADFLKWKEAAPDDFLFSVKGPRFITHIKRIRDVQIPLANFFANGILELGGQLGPVLWQFPPNFHFDKKRFEEFFKLLPQNFEAARRLGRQHDETVKGKTSLSVGNERRKIRHAIEIRHESFDDPAFFKLIREYDLALVDSDGAGQWPRFEKYLTDFIYMRLHGASALYKSGYDDPELKKLARQISTWQKVRDVFIYFDNDMKVRAPFDAMKLLELTGDFEPEYYREHPVDRASIVGGSKILERRKKTRKKSARKHSREAKS